ncbi:MAG: trehalose-phosphatase [Hyphomicrobium sp.]|nr:trehalose-phosphatase [Hyphomicrobium sp.]
MAMSSLEATNVKIEAGASLKDAEWMAAPQPSPDALLDGDVRNYALFLDCDGTLLDIAPTPSEVRVPDGLVELLVRISKRLRGALAVLTGRRLAEIDVLLTPAQLIGAGVHGAEIRTAAGSPIARVATALPEMLVEQVVRRCQALPGIIAEPKGPGLAVHYRLAPHLKDALEAELRGLLTQYPDGLVLCPGRKLFEIIPAGHSKGTALETFSALPEFAGRRPIMIGDDMGDIPAFAAARRLGGARLRVAGEHFGHDDVELQNPKRVIAWLSRLADRLDAIGD